MGLHKAPYCVLIGIVWFWFFIRVFHTQHKCHTILKISVKYLPAEDNRWRPVGKQGCLGVDKLNCELDSLVSCREFMGMYWCAYTVGLCLCFGLLLAQTRLQSFRSSLMSGFVYVLWFGFLFFSLGCLANLGPVTFFRLWCVCFAVRMYLTAGSCAWIFHSALISSCRSLGTRALTLLSPPFPHPIWWHIGWLLFTWGFCPSFCVSSILRFLRDSTPKLLEDSFIRWAMKHVT